MGTGFDQYEMGISMQTNLNYTEEFKIACKINNVKAEELLQFFIDHVSFYTFIGGEMELVYQWATKVATDCTTTFDGIISKISDVEIQGITLKYIKILTSLSLNDHLSKGSKAKQSALYIKAWSDEMLPLTNYETTFDTGPHLLQISFDFNLLCRVHGLSSGELLQCFINNISLARERAAHLFDHAIPNPAMAILLLVVINNAEMRNKVMPNQEIYRKYILLLLKLDEQQYRQPDLWQRVDCYTEFYLDWYNTLVGVPAVQI